MEGTVKFFNQSKGYGFIVSDSKEYFVHHSGILYGDKINQNDKVEFELGQGIK